MKHSSLALVLALSFGWIAACSSAAGNNTMPGNGGAGGLAFDGGKGAAGSLGLPDGSDPDAAPETDVVVDPSAPADAAGKFGGPDDPNAKPSFAYPADGVVVPPNMNSLEIHFVPGAGQTLFELTFEAPLETLIVYLGCTNPMNGGCIYQPDAQFWSKLGLKSAGVGPVSYRIRGVNGSSPNAVGTSSDQKIAFAGQSIIGGLYYWNTAGIVERYDFGYPGKSAENYLTAFQAGAGVCVGCHVLSRDGKKMVAANDIPGFGGYKVYDVATATPITANGGIVGGNSDFFSFSPDGSKLLASDGSSTGLQDMATGQFGSTAIIPQGTMPDWSPDGKTVVYAKPSQAVPGNPGVASAGLELLSFDGTNWSAPTSLVPFAGQNNYYPSFAPNNDWIIFNRSPGNNGSYGNGSAPDPQNGSANPDGELWAVSPKGGSPIRLDAGNAGGACAWPKWAEGMYSYFDGTIMWLTFSSARAYGLRLAKNAQTQLWMMAFDPNKAALGQDPSLPPFWLPFQDIGSGNYIAQWVATVARKPCFSTGDCPAGQLCQNGQCVPDIK